MLHIDYVCCGLQGENAEPLTILSFMLLDVSLHPMPDQHHVTCRDSGLESRLRSYFGSNITAAHLKMAEAPPGQPLSCCYAVQPAMHLFSASLSCHGTCCKCGCNHSEAFFWPAGR